MRIVFDLDGTLCEGSSYKTAYPISGAKDLLWQFRKAGHTIIIFTARGMDSNSGNLGKAQKDIALLTLQQLEKWDFPYDEIFFGKPAGDIYIDNQGYVPNKRIGKNYPLMLSFNQMKQDFKNFI